MKQYKLLILTDHTNHSKENSLYGLAKAMRHHPQCLRVDVATRGISDNDTFFKGIQAESLTVCTVDDYFSFSPNGESFQMDKNRGALSEYSMIWLRLPPPIPFKFLKFLQEKLPNHLIINSPNGIWETGSKGFLMNFADCCPPMKICTSVEDIIHFKNQFPIVLKPFREYGGKGIVRIQGEEVHKGSETETLAIFLDGLDGQEIEYLAVKFLKNVSEGDKRIIVVNGEIMGASLRLPASGSWICNVAMGGTSNVAQADEDEKEIIRRINPILSELGIVMYGVDTLVGDNGKRVLSEINTTSIGGITQIDQFSKKPLLNQAANLIWDYLLSNRNNNHDNR